MAHELDGLMGITNYRGCSVTKLIGGGYLIFGKTVESPFEVDELIRVAGEAIEKSLTISVTNANGAISAQNDADGTYVWER